MGSFANTLFTIMLGWLQGAVSAIWSAFTTPDGQSFLTWIGRHWILIAGILCAAGLAADLCVYLFRWKPFRVWKSFFTRGRDTEEQEEQDTRDRNSVPLNSRTAAAQEPPSAPRRTVMRDAVTEPDLSQWETAGETVPEQEPAAAKEPPVITSAGYIVPADSPYRRPAGQSSTSSANRRQTEPDPPPAYEQTKDGPEPIAPRKRRRLSVSELFSDPEEELQMFDAPQDVIDRSKAYHEPVYPRGWKKSEKDGE